MCSTQPCSNVLRIYRESGFAPQPVSDVLAPFQTSSLFRLTHGSGRRSEACTDRSPIVLTRSVRARIGGNPHPAARSEHDWKVAAYLMPARKCSVFRDTKTRIRTESLRTPSLRCRETEFLGQRQTARKGAGAQGGALGRQNLLAEPRRFGANRRVRGNLR